MRSFIFRIKCIMIKSWAIIALIVRNKGSRQEEKYNRSRATTTVVSELFLHGYESQRAKSLEAVELTARGVHTSRAFFSTSRVQRAGNPFRWVHLRGCRTVTGAFVTVRDRIHISRKRLFEFTPTARVTPARPSINNTPYAVSSRSLRSDTRVREVAVYYTTLNWHRYGRFPPSSR